MAPVRTVNEERHIKAAKAALHYLGPREVLLLAVDEIADRVRCSASKVSQDRYHKVLKKLAETIKEME